LIAIFFAIMLIYVERLQYKIKHMDFVMNQFAGQISSPKPNWLS
jgi:hypothetical protein